MKLLISSCLLGEDVRYDGGNSSIALGAKFTFSQKELFMDILCDNDIYSFCPETAGGLSTPRPPAEVVSREKPFKVETKDGDDVTFAFLMGAKKGIRFMPK